MSRADEDRILHGLYFYRESIDEVFSVSKTFPDEIRVKLLAAKLELPLRYLQYRRLIKYAKIRDASFTVSVSFAGADRAIRLHSARGRLDLWYREHRDGVVGLGLTVLVSFVTALLTILAFARFR
jgi:hypothetical protein